MQITDIKIRRLFNGAGPMKAVASITFDDCLVLHDVKIIVTGSRSFIVMPNKKNPDGSFKDIVHPINTEFRTYVESEVLKVYEAACGDPAADDEKQPD